MAHIPSKYRGEQTHFPDVTPVHNGNHARFPTTPTQNARKRNKQRTTPPDLHRIKPEHTHTPDLPPPYFPWPSPKDGRAFDSGAAKKGNTHNKDYCGIYRVPFTSSTKTEPSTTASAAFSLLGLGASAGQLKPAKLENTVAEQKKYKPPLLPHGWEPKSHLQPKPDSAFIYTGNESKLRLKWPASLKNYIARSFEDVLSEEFDAIYRELHAVILEAVQDQLHVCLDWDQMPLPSTFQHDARIAKLRKLKEEIAELDEMQRLEDEANEKRWIDNKIKRELQEAQDKVRIKRESGEEMKWQKIKTTAAPNVFANNEGEVDKEYQSHAHDITRPSMGYLERKDGIKGGPDVNCPSEVSLMDLSEADESEIFFQLHEGKHQHGMGGTSSISSRNSMFHHEPIAPKDSVSQLGTSHISDSRRVQHIERQSFENRMDPPQQQRQPITCPKNKPIIQGPTARGRGGFNSGNQPGSWGATSYSASTPQAGPMHRRDTNGTSGSKEALSGTFVPRHPTITEQNLRRAQELCGQARNAKNPAMSTSGHAIDPTNGGTLMESIHSSPTAQRWVDRVNQTRDARPGARASPNRGDMSHNSRSHSTYSERPTHSSQSFRTQRDGKQSCRGGGDRLTHHDRNDRDRNDFRGSSVQFGEGFDPRNSGNTGWASGSYQPRESSRVQASEESQGPHTQEHGRHYSRSGENSNPSDVLNTREQSGFHQIERGYSHEYSRCFESGNGDTLGGDWDDAF